MKSPFKKGTEFISIHGVEAKLIQTKEVLGLGLHYRLEILDGLNKGAKVWYDEKNLNNLFKIKN